MKNLYEIMGLKKNASIDDIKKSYKVLAIKYHPDANPGDEKCCERFKEIQSAYDILSDPVKKKEYDHHGSINGNSRSRTGPMNSVFDDFFGDVFGRKSRKKRGDNILLQCIIDLEDVINGKEYVMNYNRHVICKDCDGKGGKLDVCEQCNGKGVQMIRGSNMNVQISCSACNGVGKLISDTCNTCNGFGVSGEEQVDYKFNVPVGAETGMRFGFQGLGNPCPDSGEYGDLFIIIMVKEHGIFTRLRDGGVLCEVPVSYTQLVLGGEIEVPVVDKEIVLFTIPPGTQPNTKFRLKGKGLPKFNNKNTIYRGDQFVQVNLEIPTSVEGRYKEIIEELAILEKPNGDDSSE